MPCPRKLAAAAAILLGALVLAPAGSATAVTTNQTYTLPTSGSFTVTGHGFGHGHGMSQYGAQGAALKGLTEKQIVSFYYPGTVAANWTGRISVLLTGDTTRDVVVRPTPGLTVRDLATRAVYPLPDIAGVRAWRLNVAGTHARSVLGYLTTSWHRYYPGGLHALDGDGQFAAPSGQLTLVTPSGDHAYRGELRAATPAAGSTDRNTVNIVAIDSYLRGVVPAEMPASWRPEAVQAQAVAARSYALWSRSVNLRRYYQICDTTSCQVYRGVAGEDARSDAAVTATRGDYLRYAGKPAFTQFSSSSGGWTAAGNVRYLPHQVDPYDDWAGNGNHDWSTRISETPIERRHPRIGDLKKIRVNSREGDGDWQGRVWSMTLIGGKGQVTISGDEFRSVYRLRSSWFTITP